MIGDLLILGAAASSALAFALRMRRDRRSTWALAAAFLLSSGAVAILAAALLRGDLSYVYVHRHTSSGLPALYRVAALWTGQSGSLLFFVWCLLGVALLGGRDASAVLAGATAPLAAVSLYLSPFARQAPAAEGLGFSPVLKHPLMAVHPPAMFLGYAVAGLLFAYAVLALRSGGYREEMRRAGLAVLLLLGASLLVGCEWSYEVWQDFWSWDPAFTASMAVWLLCLGAVHLLLAERRWGRFRISAPLVSGLVFVSSLYATFVVRSGSIQSVHSFAEDPGIRAILAVALGLLALLALLATRSGAAETWPRGGAPLYVGLGSAVAVALSAVYLYGITAALAVNTFGGDAGMNGEFLARLSYPLGVAAFALLLLATRRGWRGLLPGGGAGAALLWLGWVDARGAAVTLLVTSAAAFAASRGPGGSRASHVGAALLVLGVLLAASPATADMEFQEVGDENRVGQYTVTLTDFTYEEGERFGGKFDVEGRGEGWATMRVEEGALSKGVFIDRGVLDDVYLTFGGAGAVFRGDLVVMGVTGRVIRGVPLIWLGGALTVLGSLSNIVRRREE